MSRSALWRQEGNVKERERQADENFQTVIEEGRARASRATLPLWGPDDSFHWNPLLLNNTIRSPYFQKCCQNLLDWNMVIDEIYYEVKHLHPFSNSYDKTPSTAFCLLLRLLTLRMTEHQMDLTLKHADSPYIRGIGFLYLRYTGPPDQIFRWIEPYLHDEEEFTVEPPSSRGARTITMGTFVRDLFQAREFGGTPLPRFPVQLERELKMQILLAERVAERAEHHYKNQDRMRYFRTLGSEVMALYGDEENPTTWYRAVIDRVITRDEISGLSLTHPKFVVTFTEYGNTDTVSLGEMDVIDGKWRDEGKSSASGDAHSGKHGHSGGRGGRDDRDLYDEVRRRERDTAASRNKDAWSRRPATTKSMLSQPQQRSHASHYEEEGPRRPPSPTPHRGGVARAATSDSAIRKPPPAKKARSAEDMASIAEKKRKLMAKYG